ncbi:MAG: vWA domain-containing protein [Flavobacteriales bacterium]
MEGGISENGMQWRLPICVNLSNLFNPCSVITIVYAFFANVLIAQIEITPKQLNFGTSTSQTQWVVDVIIQNKSDEKDFLLRHTFSHEYEVLFTSKTLMPDSSITMRVKFKPREKGNFSENIELYFASMPKPLIFKVSAIIDYKNPDDNIPCPDFSRLAADCCANNMFICEVVDAATQKPITDASIIITEEQTQRLKLATNNEGKVSQTIPISYYTLSASHKNYLPESTSSYINHRNSYFRFELQAVQNEIIEEKEEPIVQDTLVADTALVITSSALPEDLYKPNNIVFLLDVSGSMKTGDKMKLMQATLKELVQVLRPTDKITLISYAQDSKVLLASTSGDHKETIISIVNEIKADGKTAGAAAFKSAYAILRQEMITDGNNQLIVVTDGAFEPDDQSDINKLVKKAAKKNIKTSIVGIEANAYAADNLQAVSTIGRGSFVWIKTSSDLQLIIDEIKKQSAK